MSHNRRRDLSQSCVQETGCGTKIKVLNILGGLDRGGVETWVMHILRNIDKDRFQIDFMVHSKRECSYDSEARELGSRIFTNPHHRNPLRYARAFREINRKYGPYDVVHSHVHFYSGYTLFLAEAFNIPIRIAHSHTDIAEKSKSDSLIRRCYYWTMHTLIRKHSTVGIGVSRNAADNLFGNNWSRTRQYRVIYYGIDFSLFESSVNAKDIRGELGLPEYAYVVGNVGRFVEAKNHHYLIKIAREACENMEDICILLVGDGPLRSDIEKKAIEFGISDKVIFAGTRSDVPKLMLGAMDLFLFPSLYEGLPVALLEAQAAGLPCVVSNAITEEVGVIKENVHRLSLSEPPAVWAETIQAIRNSRKAYSQKECVEMMKNSRFNIESCVRQIEELYSGR